MEQLIHWSPFTPGTCAALTQVLPARGSACPLPGEAKSILQERFLSLDLSEVGFLLFLRQGPFFGSSCKNTCFP